MDSSSRTITRGPLFDGRASLAMKAFEMEARHAIGETGVGMVRARLDQVLKHPTGYYSSNVTYEDPRIFDSGVIYGPWLEGVSSRNRTTRFKGYATFRKVKQQLQPVAVSIAERILRFHIGRMN